jgi:dephospho-CoA kinase
MILGLSGKYCAGKSTVAAYLRDNAWLHIDVDKVGHEVLQEQSEAVSQAFGQEIRLQDGTIDRKALGALVFADGGKRKRLEAIVHPAMVERVAEMAAAAAPDANGDQKVVVDAALLFYMGLHRMCDRILFIEAPSLIRYFRGRSRDGISWKGFRQRNRSQMHIVSQAKSEGADIHSVSNWLCRQALFRSVDAVVQP